MQRQLSVNAYQSVDQRHYHMIAADTNGDGIDEIAFGGDRDGMVFDGSGRLLCGIEGRSAGRGQHAYSMLLLDKIPGVGGRASELVGRYASSIRRYGPGGGIQTEVPLAISPADLSYDPTTKTLLLGSGISGGDCIYCVRIDQPGWEDAISGLGYRGKLAQLVSNLQTLASQVEAFQPPPYQRARSPDMLCVFGYGPYNPGSASELAPKRSLAPLMELYQTEFPYAHLHFAGNQWFSEDWDRSHLSYGWDRIRDQRMKYRLTSEEIVVHAARLEREGLAFVMTAGNGNDLSVGLQIRRDGDAVVVHIPMRLHRKRTRAPLLTAGLF